MALGGHSNFQPQAALLRPVLVIVALVVLRAVGGPSKKDQQAHIQCEMCGLMVTEANKYATDKNLTSDDEIADLVEHLCMVKRKEGRWITSIDLSMVGETLHVTRHDDVGECKHECEVGRKACVNALGGKEDDLKKLLLGTLGWQRCKGNQDVLQKKLQEQKVAQIDRLDGRRVRGS